MTDRHCPRIQIAGVLDQDEALLLARLGVNSIGIPLRLAVHPEDISEDEAARIVQILPNDVPAVLITYVTDPEEIRTFCDQLGVTHVQLHADISATALAALKSSRPDLYVIKSIIVPPTPDAISIQRMEKQILSLAPYCDAFLTDTYDPSTGATGATGKVHDWSASRRLVELSPIPLILAGGLTPGNVRQAILQVKPAGVDAHTGVETPDGRKSPELVATFVKQALAGFESLSH
ncbi:phosphoribosylanthranilate isomerase [Desulfovibrio ferrophilus]|uniref:N-(5'-phosphoribosyl)anthranilate isomerase n=1 Tax=Desulfovibrio ferrophilus TaxID=241368 RepID=A0A2Z6AUE1_9BACT|nr:phosphoribosylanthranilate isomerase [Desulfovibrio ferrophilus]BBD06840.1 N-(5'-phosphoribosyl)anthranilate isomerase [Desulfovibrio ferrophilus]